MALKLFDSDTESSISEASDHSDWVLDENDITNVVTSSSSDSENENNENQTSIQNQQLLKARNGRIWNTVPPTVTRAPQANILRENMQCTRESRNIQTILDMFKLLITRQIVEIIVQETNRKAKFITEEWNVAHPENIRQWQECDNIEIYAFMGLLLLAGVYRSMNESLQELWSKENGRPIFRATMNIRRFKELLRYLRFDDFNTRQIRLVNDKLASIREVWRQFIFRLHSVYIPSWKLTIDEQLLVTRGRCAFRQYIPSKPGKYGIKIYWLCDSLNSFPLNGEVYVGKQPGHIGIENSPTELVMRLSQPWLNSGRNITGDNFFTSSELTERLLNNRTTYVGTIRKNKRDIPNELFASRSRTVESSIFCFDNQLTLVSYVPKRNKSVILLSSMHHSDEIQPTNHNKPDIIHFYNQTKSGVDNFDHLARVYSCKRRTKRWPMTIFFNILDSAAIASYVLWILRFPNWDITTSHRRRNFLKELSGSLIGPFIQRRIQNPRALQPGVRSALKALGYQLLNVQQPHLENINVPNQNRKRCIFCRRNKDRKSKSICSNCQVSCCSDHQIILCPACNGDI